MDQDYTKVEDVIKEAVRQWGARSHVGDSAAVKGLQPENVIVAGAPRTIPSTGGFVAKLEGITGDPRERLDTCIQFHLNPKGDTQTPETDLRAADHGQVEAGVLEAFRGLFSKIQLPAALGGGTLADKYDWSNKPAESEKPYKEQLADLKAQIDAGIAQAQGAIPPEVVTLLQHAKTFDEAAGSVFGYDFGKPLVSDDRVHVNLSVSTKAEGEKNNSALVQENILARKEAILDAIRQTIKAQHPGVVSDEELSKLDLQVISFEREYGGNVNISIGSKLTTEPRPYEPTVGPSPVAKLSEDILNRIIKDSVLLVGQGAGNVAHLVAGDTDIRHFLELYKDKAPAFAEALNDSDILKNFIPRKEREELEKKQESSKLIKPSLSIDSSTNGDKLNNNLHIAIDLPKGVTHSQVIRALEGKPIVMGPATERLATGASADEASKASGKAA